MTAPWKIPGTGPERVATLPRVYVSAVTPTSVAPPFPPAGAAAVWAGPAAAGEPVADAPDEVEPPAVCAAAAPVVSAFPAPASLVPPEAAATGPVAEAAVATPPDVLALAVASCAGVARDPHAVATRASTTPATRDGEIRMSPPFLLRLVPDLQP